jgi:branched-chain amino acid transport system substrate-binding protein
MSTRWRNMAAATTALILVAGCAAGKSENDAAAGDCSQAGTLKVGLIGGMTGVVSETVVRGFNSAKLAIRQANEEGTLKLGCQNYKIDFVEGDDKNDTAEAATVMRRLIQIDKVDVVVGSYTSVVALAQMDVAEQLKKPFIIVGASTSKIPATIKEKGYKYTFMSSPVAPERGKVEAVALQDLLAPKKIFMVYQDTGFGHDVTTALTDGLKATNASFESKGEVVDPGTTNYGPAVAQILSYKPDLVYAALSGPEMYSFIEQFRSRDAKTQVFASGSDFPSSDFFKTLGDTSEGIIGNLAWVPTKGNPVVEKFATDFQKTYTKLPADVEAQTYDGFQMLFGAMKTAKSKNADDLVTALLATEVDGVRGKNKYQADDHSTRDLKFIIGQARGGKHVLIWPEDIKTGEYQKP